MEASLVHAARVYLFRRSLHTATAGNNVKCDETLTTKPNKIVGFSKHGYLL